MASHNKHVKDALSKIKDNLGHCYTDIKEVNYTSNASSLENFQKITDPFCDNIVVAALCDKGDVDRNEKKIIREKFGQFELGKNAVKRKQSIPFKGKPSQIRKAVKRVIIRGKTTQYENSVIAFYKIELAEICLQILSDQLPEIIENLKNVNMMIWNIDITQDFAGIFNKQEMREYLQKSDASIKFKNKKSIGIDCLMWDDWNARVKIYNKFICEMTCPGVEKSLGNHIVDFIYNRDKHMRDTFTSDLAKNHGITRLEATIYNKGESDFYQIESGRKVLEKNLRHLNRAPLYSVPISTMWTKLTDTLESSFCVVNKNILFFVYWGNKITKKITGVQVNLPPKDDSPELRQNLIDYALSAFSFKQLPIYYCEISDSNPNQNLLCYKKKEGKTYFSRSPIGYSDGFSLTTIPAEIQIEDTGLIRTAKVEPEVLRDQLPNINKPHEIEQVETDKILQ